MSAFDGELNARTWFTPKQRAELRERWRSGQCVADITRALERTNKTGVYRVLALNGGIAPLPRRRAQRALRLAEREEISRGIAAGTIAIDGQSGEADESTSWPFQMTVSISGGSPLAAQAYHNRRRV
jgi:hypothetical protein